MTVQELIEKLEGFPQAAKVMVESADFVAGQNVAEPLEAPLYLEGVLTMRNLDKVEGVWCVLRADELCC